MSTSHPPPKETKAGTAPTSEGTLTAWNIAFELLADRFRKLPSENKIWARRKVQEMLHTRTPEDEEHTELNEAAQEAGFKMQRGA